MKFEDLVKINTLNFMFRANSLVLHHNLQLLFLPKNHNKFHRIKLRTDRKSLCFSNIGPKLWNNIKESDQFIKTSHIFKRTIKRKIILKYD